MRLPYGHGDLFPAFFTHRSGVDKDIIDLMRPLFNKGVRPEAFSTILLELQSKEYTMSHLARENRIKRDLSAARRLGQPYNVPGRFSEFADKKGYAGLVPTGAYLEHVYVKHSELIKEHLENEVCSHALGFVMVCLRIRVVMVFYRAPSCSIPR